MKNLNLLFNKTYFNGIKESGFKGKLRARNWGICNVRFSQNKDFWDLDEKICPPDQRFLMKTTYPGLLAGLGYAHDVEADSDDCVKLGFSFDYTTGQPYVPGSSVKGMLRSCFRQPEAIGEILDEIGQSASRQGSTVSDEDMKILKANVKALETSIFDGGDVFFDAVLYSGDRDGKVMDCDYITPHKGETKNPIPLLMMKVLPEVFFEFRFKLKDSDVEGGADSEEQKKVHFTAKQKIDLFQNLIELFGVGAKTNAGYGTLTRVGVDETNGQVAHGAGRYCLACGRVWFDGGDYPLCPKCREKASRNGKCAICGKVTDKNENDRFFPLCKECNQEHNP